jgi:glutathionylspermidine synthase
VEKLKDEEIHNRARIVGNEVYASVIKQVQDQEPRGFNAHHVAQEACEEAKKAVKECLQRYRSYIKCCPDEDLEPNTTMQFMVCQKCGWTSKDPSKLPSEPEDLYT